MTHKIITRVSVAAILAAAMMLSIAGCTVSRIYNVSRTQDRVANQPQPGEIAVINSDIIVNKPLSDDVITSPFDFSGRAADTISTIFVRLKDGLNTVIASSSVQVGAGSSSLGFFSGSMSYSIPIGQNGTVEFYSLNEKDKTDSRMYNLISLPVTFKQYQKRTVKIFFSNPTQNSNPKKCDAVFPVEREIDLSDNLPAAAIAELINGPTESDKQSGYVTALPTEGVKVQKFEINDGVAAVDFNDAFQLGVSGACRVATIKAEINSTLLQFADIKRVVISVNSSTKDILRP